MGHLKNNWGHKLTARSLLQAALHHSLLEMHISSLYNDTTGCREALYTRGFISRILSAEFKERNYMYEVQSAGETEVVSFTLFMLLRRSSCDGYPFLVLVLLDSSSTHHQQNGGADKYDGPAVSPLTQCHQIQCDMHSVATRDLNWLLTSHQSPRPRHKGKCCCLPQRWREDTNNLVTQHTQHTHRSKLPIPSHSATMSHLYISVMSLVP